MVVPAPERELARRLLAREASDVHTKESPAGPAAAAERVFERLRAHLTRSIGAEGFRMLLARAIDRSRSEHPLLASVPRRTEPDWSVNGVAESLRTAAPAEAAEALVVLVATFIALLGRFVGTGLAVRLVEQSWPAASRSDHTSSGKGEESHG